MAQKTRYHHGDLRSALIDAAIELIRTDGPDAFAMADAARMAGVSTAAPYRHFQNREDLLGAVAAEGMKRLRESMLHERGTMPTGTVGSIAAIGHGYVRFAAREPHLFMLMFHGVAESENPESDPRTQCAVQLRQVLLDEVAAFYGLSDPEIVLKRSVPLWTFVHGASVLWIHGRYTHHMPDFDVFALIREAIPGLLNAPQPDGAQAETTPPNARHP